MGAEQLNDPTSNLVRFEISVPGEPARVAEHHVATRTEDGVIRAWRVVSSRERIDISHVTYIYSDWSLTAAERGFIKTRFSNPELEHWFERPASEGGWSRALRDAKRELERDSAQHQQKTARSASWGGAGKGAFSGGILLGGLVFMLVGVSAVLCCSGKFLALPETTHTLVERAREGNVAGLNFTHTAWQRDGCMSECRTELHPNACVEVCDCFMDSYKGLGSPVVTEENQPEVWAEVATECAHIADPIYANAFFHQCNAECSKVGGGQQCMELCECGRSKLLRADALLLLSEEEIEGRIDSCL